ncbi:MAG: PAS domain-containing protein [Reichenbachiella sp.]
MYKNISIRQKLMRYVLGLSILIYVGSIGHMSYKFKDNAVSEAKNLLETYTQQKANEIGIEMTEDLTVARSMASIVLGFKDREEGDRIELQKSLMIGILEKNPQYGAVWLSWELGAIDPSWEYSYGRERTTYFYENGRIEENIERLNLEGDNLNGDYFRLKTDKNEEVIEPYLTDDYKTGSEGKMLVTSPSVPIIQGNRFLGLIGTDSDLDRYKESVFENKFEQGYSFLISNNGNIVAHPDKDMVNKGIDSLKLDGLNELDFKTKMKNGGLFSLKIFDEVLDENVLISVIPIELDGALNPWSLASVVPVSEITKDFESSLLTSSIYGFAGLLILVIVLYKISNDITLSISKSKELLKNISLGKLDQSQKLEVLSKDEVGEIADSVNKLLVELNMKAEFSKQIGEGKLDAEFEVTSAHDDLGNSLLNMRDNLKTVLGETKNVINNAGQEGQLEARIELEGKVGVWQDLSESINSLLTSIATPLMAFNKIFNAMASGDLTARYSEEAKGDIKKMTGNLNLALDNLDGLFNQISKNALIIDESSTDMQVASEEMNTNTREIASAIAQMSNGAQTQVTKVDESSNLIESILTTSNEMGVKAENINNSAKIGVESSEKGMGMVNEVVDNIGEISNHSAKANDSIQILKERSSEIARVLGVITDIASQTNLLALNAAIEAAQAGDAGRGFAVVAEEIRKLAEDSRNSAKAIEKLVNDVQVDTNEAAKSIEIMTSSVQIGQKTSIEAADVFKEIFESSTDTLSVSEEIVNATKAQTTGINDVVSIIEGVVVIAEQTAAGTEEVASSATELSAGMNGYKEKTVSLADIAESLKDGLSMVKFSGASSENTAIFKMKEAFEKEKYLLDALMNYIPDTIYFKDKDSKFIRNSMSHAKQFSMSDPADLVGMSDFDFFGEHAQNAYDQEMRIIETEKPDIGVLEKNDLKDGTIAYASSTKLPLYDLEGKVVGTFGITRDVSELHNSLEELKNLREENEKLKNQLAV